ncbi:MAG: SAF domain-containing protein, partial [Candidatus Dormibacteria bacterium]
VLIAMFVLVYLRGQAQKGVFQTAYIAAHDLSAGAQIADADVRAVRVPATGDRVNFMATSPSGRRLAISLGAGDPILEHALLAKDAFVEVPISTKSGLDIHAGDKVDVFAQLGGQNQMIGHNIILVSPTVALVPIDDEGDWVTVAGSGTQLLIARSSGLSGRLLPSSGLSANDALRHLATVARGGSAPSSGTP